MYRRWPALTLTAALILAAPGLPAREPDGRFALAYQWTAAATSGSSRPLRLALTAIVPLAEVRVSGEIPVATSVTIRELRIGGVSAPGSLGGRWPDAGVPLGSLARGETVVFELEVIEPEQGGGILAIGVDGLAGERVVHEGIGIPVGAPGVVPTIRNGAIEFPAQRRDPAP